MKKGLLAGLAALCGAYAGVGATDLSQFNSEKICFEIDKLRAEIGRAHV